MTHDNAEQPLGHAATRGRTSIELASVKNGGGEAAVRRHKERGKMFVRERIDAVIDPDTPFLEFSALATANGMYSNEAPDKAW